jgi:hypothetical protein
LPEVPKLPKIAEIGLPAWGSRHRGVFNFGNFGNSGDFGNPLGFQLFE